VRTCLRRLTAMVLVTLLASAPAGAGGTPKPEPWFRTAEESPSGAAEVLLGHEVVIRLRSPAGELTADERAQVVAARLASLLYHGLDPNTIVPTVHGGEIVVAASGLLIVTVDRPSADRQGITPFHLALAWSNNLRKALGAPPLEARVETGLASWYGPGFHGRRAASGEVYDQYALTAAHRTLPFGTVAVVVRPDTGASVAVRITDRGPWVSGRIIDLSLAAARELGLVAAGVLEVLVKTWTVVTEDGR